MRIVPSKKKKKLQFKHNLVGDDDRTGDKEYKNYLIQNLCMAIQRGNAAIVLGSLPFGEALVNIFHL